MSGDAKEHVYVWLQIKTSELRREAHRLRCLLDEAGRRVVDLELSMPTDQDGDVAVPCWSCGAKMTFTGEALKTLSHRFPTR